MVTRLSRRLEGGRLPTYAMIRMGSSTPSGVSAAEVSQEEQYVAECQELATAEAETHRLRMLVRSVKVVRAGYKKEWTADHLAWCKEGENCQQKAQVILCKGAKMLSDFAELQRKALMCAEEPPQPVRVWEAKTRVEKLRLARIRARTQALRDEMTQLEGYHLARQEVLRNTCCDNCRRSLLQSHEEHLAEVETLRVSVEALEAEVQADKAEYESLALRVEEMELAETFRSLEAAAAALNVASGATSATVDAAPASHTAPSLTNTTLLAASPQLAGRTPAIPQGQIATA